MAKYNDPSTGKTVEARNLKEARKLFAAKPKPKVKAKPKPKAGDGDDSK